MYKIINDSLTGETVCILKVVDKLTFPLDESNRDYQEYLKWLSAGNEPLPADEPAE